MGLDTPEITVLISTYNDRSFVQKKLGEIQGQTAFERAEFIFIESASPGKERELLQPFCLDHDNCNLITLDERVGLYRAWNIGWETSAAPLVCISNMDDAMHPRLLECVLDEIPKSNFDLLSVLIAKQGIDSSWNSFAPTRLKQLALSTRPGPFFVWRRDLKNDFGMFDG